MFVCVKEFESTPKGTTVVIGVCSVPGVRLRIICCGNVAEEDSAGEEYELVALEVAGRPVSAFPASRSPIFGKSRKVGVQNCVQFGRVK